MSAYEQKHHSVRGGFQQVSCRFSDSLLIQLFFLLIKKVRKPAGNRHGRFPEVSGGFPDNPLLTDHTVGCKFRQIYVQQFKTPVDKTGTVCCHFSSLEAEPATQNSRIVAYISLSSRLGDDSKPAYLGLFCIRRPLGVSHKAAVQFLPFFGNI